MTKVTIERHRNKLRLRWRHQGTRYTLSTHRENNAIGLAYAGQLKSQIELDIQAGYFDPSLLKYRPRVAGPNASEISVPDLLIHFTQNEAKVKSLAPGSLRWYENLQSHVQKCLNIPAHHVGDRQASDFNAYLMEHLSANTVKRHVYSLSNCWIWGYGKYHVAKPNPWAPLLKKIKPSPKQRVKPFTRAEIAAILEAFKVHQHYRHYYTLVQFLANTGVRFGEAAALCWKHIGESFQTVWIGESVSRGNRKATKTNKARTIILNATIVKMLRDQHKRIQPKPCDLVFPSPKGLEMNDQRFRQRAWKTILSSCNIEYRSPYALRHSVASHAAASGLNPIAIAEQLGHDKRVFLSTYAHAIHNQTVFPEF